MFWLRVLAIAQMALLVAPSRKLLESDERSRLAKLVGKSKGRPAHNLTANEREEMLRLVHKLEPGPFAHRAWSAARGRSAKQ